MPVSTFKLPGVFALAAALFAALNYQEGKQESAAFEAVRNEMIVSLQMAQTRLQIEQAEASDQQEDAAKCEEDASSTYYPRVVQTVRFIIPDAPRDIGAKAERVSKGKPYTIHGRTFVPTDNPSYRAEGIASWYGPDFHGRRTANGERYDMRGISAAHRTMPLPSYARVTNLDNGRSIIVRVNNRGPFVHKRIVDLSIGTAKALDFYSRGTAHVRVEYVGRAPIEGSDDQMLLATLRTGTPAPAPSTMMVASAKPFAGKVSDATEPRLPTEH
jgi:rare lipoprotein A (peptidoglycan hydrolase)